jgi:hypothetical protein
MSEPLTGFRFDIRSAIQELITRHHFLAADVSFAEPLQVRCGFPFPGRLAFSRRFFCGNIFTPTPFRINNAAYS